ncbi:unnamed protein product [Ectocarpus sp. CCAP 1310/34]|nr:unnamed protein product [Ectocarpus sp. CCAP 1310/34]
MAKKGKEDGSVAETLEEKVQELATDAKEETSGSTSSPGVLDTLKGGFQTITGGMGMAGQTLGEWKDQGTPLRRMFKTARLDLEDATAKAREKAACRQTKMRENLQKMAEERQARFKEFDKSGALTKCSEIKKQHPELVVGGFTLAVALPSALAGRRAFFRNGARALVLSSAVVYGGAWMKRRGLIPPQLVGSDDSEAPPPQ